jgi:vacuolar-type H+-ATPase subunit E/Vma4
MKLDSGSLKSVMDDIKKDISQTEKQIHNKINKEIEVKKKEFEEELKKETEEQIEQGKKIIMEEMNFMIEENKLKLRRKLLELKKKMFDKYLSYMKNKIKDFQKTKEYKQHYSKIIKMLEKKYGKIMITCNKEDYSWIKKIAKTSPEFHTKTGIIAKKDSIKIDLTIENMFNRNIGKISKRFFE